MSDIVIPDGTQGLELIAVKHGAFGQTGSGDTSGFGGLVEVVTMAPASQRPYGKGDQGVDFDELADEIDLSLAARGINAAIEKVVVDRGEITFFVQRDRLVDFVTALRDEPGLRFEMCLGVNGVHYPSDAGLELHAVYHFLSITHNRRLRVEVTAPDADARIPSIVSIYPTCDWHERETWDFFGIVFEGHHALTRIAMPDDWPGHPQRKDYPLGGIPVEYKGATTPPPDQRRSYN